VTSRARAALFAVAVAVFAPASARATNRIYWGNLESDVISFTEVSGSGVGADIDTTGATVQHPMGLALDPAHNRIYWANWGSDAGKTISYANLDGSGDGGDLPINPTYVTGPHGLAIDPVAGRLYWPNSDQGTIGFANIDGSGAGFLPTGVATIDHPRGLAIDPATRRIYWANYGDAFGTTISYASLNGTGGADLANVTGATVEGPEGVALDPPNNRIYWGNFGPGTAGTGDTIAYANLDGTGDAANLATPGADIARVHGVAIDPTAGRIYWANYGYATPTPGNSTLASAALDGGGGGQIHVDHNAVTEVGPELPVLLDQPQGIGVPVVSGTATVGSTLSCTQGKWAQDLISALLYRAPQNLAYAWTRDGVPLDGATSSSTSAAAPGAYRCVVSASNAAGTSGQTSAPLTVPKPPPPVNPPPSNQFTIGGLARDKRRGRAKLKVTTPGPGELGLDAGAKLKPVDVAVSGGESKLKIRARGKTAKRLQAKGHVKVQATITFVPSGWSPSTQRVRVKLIQKRRR
jgi:DNA-binding beta-propeller fold protein YncE